MDAIDEILARAGAKAEPDDPELSFLKKDGGDAVDRILAKANAPEKPEGSPAGRAYPNAHLDTLKADLEAAVPEKPTIGSAARATAGYVANTARAVGGAVGSIAGSKGAVLLDPAARRELERGIDDAVTLGYGQRFADKVGGLVDKDPAHSLSGTAAADAAAQPDFRATGNVAGMFLPGASKLIGQAGGKAAQALTSAPARTALGAAAEGAVKGVAGYEATAPLTAALSADASGHRLDAAERAATDPVGLITSGVAGGATAGGAKAVENSRGAQARRFIEEAGQGAKVTVASPGKGGVFERELAGVPANDKGIGQAARIGSQELIDQIAEQHRVETTRPYKAMLAKLNNSPAALQTRNATSLVTKMQDAIDDLETSSQARSALKEHLDLIEKYRDPKTGEAMIPERQLNGLRRSLMRVAKAGATTAKEADTPLLDAAGEAKRLVDQGPYRMLNGFYSIGSGETQGRRKLLTGSRSARKGEMGPEQDLNAASLALQGAEPRSNSATAGKYVDRINALRAQNPGLVPATDLPSLARARADLAFRLTPQHGGVFGRLGHAGLPGAGALGLGALALHAGPVSLAPAATLAAVMNRNAINGRILAPIARAAPAAGDIGQRLARALYASQHGLPPPDE